MTAEPLLPYVSDAMPSLGSSASGSAGGDESGAELPPEAGEFLIFTKPEIGALGAEHRRKFASFLSESLARYDVHPVAAVELSGDELSARRLMDQHYGVINTISRTGLSGLTESARGELVGRFPDAEASSSVLGGHQFLERFPEFTPGALAILFANLEVTRLGPGAYAAQVNVDGEAICILNGFHPRQLMLFTNPDATCVFLRCWSSTDWKVLRDSMIGATNPATAGKGSIRGALYADPDGYGLSVVSSNFNAVHMSAGPLEGLTELQRFFGDDSAGAAPWDGWHFGRSLIAAGFTVEQINWLVGNPDLESDGGRESAFDLTETVNPKEAVELLRKAHESPADPSA